MKAVLLLLRSSASFEIIYSTLVLMHNIPFGSVGVKFLASIISTFRKTLGAWKEGNTFINI
jgi:hypothetical protein